jgi:hypothetical protein
MNSNFRKVRIDIFNKQQLEIEIQSIEILIRKLEQEKADKSQLLAELRQDLEEKRNHLSQIS